MRHIIVVDDCPEMLTFLGGVLEDSGLRCWPAISGKEAEKLLMVNRFDLVITDLEMPDGDGMWLMKRIALLKDPPPVILVSGNISLSEEEARNGGATAFFRKPYCISDFLEAVNKLSSGK